MRRSSAELQLRLRLAHYRSQQGMGELPPDRRADLRHLLGGAEPVKPRHQRGVQACGDRQGRGRNRSGGPLGFALALRLQHRLRHFLDKQRNAVGALDDVLPDVRRQQLVADNARRSWRRFRALPSRLRVRASHAAVRSTAARTPGGTSRSAAREGSESGPRPDRKASRLVGSVQCASSKIISTGFWRVSASICAVSASSVLCRRCCGVSSSAG